MTRRLKNWEFYYSIYLEEKKKKTVHRRMQTQLT